jgi:hypothetical protein
MAQISTKPNRFYPSIPGIGDSPDTHANALRQIRESIETHERRNSNYLKSFIRFEELVQLGIIDEAGNFTLDTSGENTGETSINLTDLADVDIGGVADNQILGYDFASGLWTNQTATELGLAEAGHTHPGLGGGSLGDLTDVDLTGGSQYDLLYLGATEWLPTMSMIQWSGDNLHLATSNLYFFPVGSSGPGIYNQSGDLSINSPNGTVTTVAGGNILLEPGVTVEIVDATLAMDSNRGINWEDSNAVEAEFLVLGGENGPGPLLTDFALRPKSGTALNIINTISTVFVNVTDVLLMLLRAPLSLILQALQMARIIGSFSIRP